MTITNPIIPLGSLVLVTGANGLVASHVADQFLHAGYRVRGTVRSITQNMWMLSLFDQKYGLGSFTLVEVSDVTSAGAWDAAVAGVSGVAHVLSAAEKHIIDSDKAAEDEMLWQVRLLDAARNMSTVKSVVYTSSGWAAYHPSANEQTIKEWSWNESAIEMAKSGDPSKKKGLVMYMAFKTLVEQKIWDWVQQHQPPFTFNTVLVATALGRTLQPKELGMPSTAGMVQWVYEGSNTERLSQMPPQWCVDTADAGRVYVAALTTAGVNGERIFAFGDRYSWAKVAEILARLFPDQNVPTMADSGWDHTVIPNQRATQLLHLVKRGGWTSLEESVKAGAECFST